MNSILIASLRTLLAEPDSPYQNALFAVLDNTHASYALACLVSPGSLLQIAAALRIGWSWDGDGWERQIDKLVDLITNPRWRNQNRMIETWSSIPSAVGVLRDRTDDLIAWAQQRLLPAWYTEMSTLLGPSNAAARLLVQSPSSNAIGRTLRLWSMATDPDDPTAWQAMIDADLREPLRRKAHPSWAFPAWGWDDAVDSVGILTGIVNDIIAGWSPDHPSLRGRIAWLEHHVDSDLDVGFLALVASIGRSDALAETVCARIGHDPSSIPRIAEYVPWSRLHPRIQTVIDTTMQRSSDDQWKRMWACAIGDAPVVSDTSIVPTILLWRIEPERWDALEPSIRAPLVARGALPHHCFGWGVHPDLVAGKDHLYGDVFCLWNPDVLPDDLRAWVYAYILHAQNTLQAAQTLIALLDVLPSNRRARFEAIIDWRLGGHFRAPAQPPWDWAGWVALPAPDRQTRLRDRLAVLWGDCATSPAVRCRRARNDGLATLALMVGEVLDLDDPTPILAALLAQVLGLRGDETDAGSLLPFPDDLDAALRAQIERLSIDRDAQAYAAWCLWLLARGAHVGADLLALHPDVAVALAPVLSTEQRAVVTASPGAQGWNSMTLLHWTAACASAEEPTTPPTQRRL